MWEKEKEDFEIQLKDNVPVLLEISEKEIVCDLNQTTNLLIEGDNLHALKILEQTHRGTVDVIYIDPPYNTGAAFEHYDDNMEHSIWLNLMYQRLRILHRLLSDDGSLWISIDNTEGHYLKVLCDEIFMRQNFVADIT